MTILKMPSAAKNLYANNIAQRVASNFGWSIVSQAVGKGVFFVANIYLARTLGVSNFGLFTMAQALILYFWLGADLGTNMYGIREIAKRKDNAEEIINPLLTLRVTSGFIVFALYSISLLFFDMPGTKKLAFAAAGLYLITYSFYMDWVLKGLEKFKYIVFGNLISSIVFFAGVILFVRGRDNVAMACLIWASSYLFGSLSLAIFVFRKLGIKYRPSINLKLWIFHFRESIHFTFSGSFIALYQYLPILLISIYLNSYEVGLFSAPYRIVIAAGSAGSMLPMSFYPVFSELYHNDKGQFHNTHKMFQIMLIVIGFLAAIIGTIFADETIRILLGSQYLKSVAVFKILVWLVPLYFLGFTYGTALLATGFQKYHNITAFLGVICMLAFGLYLIPKFSVIGGSCAAIAAEVAVVGAMLVISQYTFKKTCP